MLTSECQEMYGNMQTVDPGDFMNIILHLHNQGTQKNNGIWISEAFSAPGTG